MYINKIDELVDKILDDFYNTIIVQEHSLSKILDEVNFIKYQIDINKIMTTYVSTIDETFIRDIVTSQENVNIVIDIIKRYIAYYIFLTIGFYYKHKKDMFINNVIEFSKNQPSFNFRVDNFFNGESNSNIIRLYDLIQRILSLLNAETAQYNSLSKKKEMQEAVSILNEFDEQFRLTNTDEQAHNIIKTLIISELYLKNDKSDVYLILENEEKEKGLYTFIDIVVPKTEFIDFNSIENALSPKDVERGLAYEIYDLITEQGNEARESEVLTDEKILLLINNKIIVPIVDDFLLYHKDSEKYEKNVQEIKKKKDDTKIRYIVSKIDSVTEYYSKETQGNPAMKETIDRLFYAPISNRKAILVNAVEDINIINNLVNQGRRAIENNEFYNDLVTYKEYPYINFKNFKEYGFTINLDKNVDLVRYSNIENRSENVRNRYLDLRIGYKGQAVNIVGFMIPDKSRLLHCLSENNLHNIANMSFKQSNRKLKFDNSYLSMLKFIKHTMFKQGTVTPAVYWIINPTKDTLTLSTYEQTSNFSDSENVKLISASLFDDIVQIVYTYILNKIKSRRQITAYEFNRLVKYVEIVSLNIKRFNDLYNKLLHLAYFEKYFKTEDRYDKNEDKFPGLTGDVIELPSAEKHNRNNIPRIRIKTTERKTVEVEELEESPEKYGAICQHIITWEQISEIRKKNPNQFSNLLFEFVMQYVVENYEGDYICKSCGVLINIKNYVLDGSYDESGRFITLSMPMNVNIEDLPEYEKFRATIRNIDKLVDRVGSTGNIHFLSEKTSRQRNPIKSRIVKDCIDLLLVHNTNMREVYKNRAEKTVQTYGIDKELTNFFVFELDNSIFIYSSKDKDYYKSIKRNNILIYIILLIILEFNDSQVIYLLGDKTCNYSLFSRYGYPLFNNLKIIKNNKGNLAMIQNYKVLCYLIFYISCFVTKYQMWQYDAEEKTKKFNPLIQKIIVNTLVDLLNSILEVYSKKKERDYIYDIVSVKFFQKLGTLYQNNDILRRVKEIEDRRIVNDSSKKKTQSNKDITILLADEYHEADYQGLSQWFRCRIAKYFLERDTRIFPRYYSINNVTNCEDGNFHIWTNKGKTMECKLCQTLLNELELDTELTAQILENYRYKILSKIGRRYCKEGSLHNFVHDQNLKCNVCTRCKYENNASLTNEELDELEQKIVDMRGFFEEQKKRSIEKKLDTKDKILDKYDQIFSEIKSRYAKTKRHKEDYFNHINILIDEIDKTIGKNININNEDQFTRDDVYIIDHDHNGYTLPNPIIIVENENKILYKKAHGFFKTDVLYYTNNRLQIDVYYDATTLLLLGYKERNRDFEYSKRNNIYIKRNYSIFNKLKLLGYTGQHILLENYVHRIKQDYKLEDSQKILSQFVTDVSRQRILQLKKILTDIQKYIYRLKYDYNEPDVTRNTPLEENEEIIADTTNDLTNKYRTKLRSFSIKDKERVFKDWKAVKYNIFFQELGERVINLTVDPKFMTAEEVSFYDYHGNVILFYIVEQLVELLDINRDKFTKINLCYFIIDIINRVYNEHTQEEEYTNSEIKRFKYILESDQYVNEFEQEELTEGNYEEYKDPDEKEDETMLQQKEDDQEEMDALDIEEGLDYEVDYAADINSSG